VVTGIYLTTALPVGEYRIEGTARGFKRALHTGPKLELKHATVDRFQARSGYIDRACPSDERCPPAGIDNIRLGKVVDNRRILDLPLNTRNAFTLINLTDGALGSSTFRSDGQA
jgi:hypothetical protein